MPAPSAAFARAQIADLLKFYKQRATPMVQGVSALCALWALPAMDASTFALWSRLNASPTVAVTATLPTATGPAGTWATTDIGAAIAVSGAGAASGVLNAVITAVAGDGSSCTMSTNAVTTQAATIAAWGLLNQETDAAPLLQADGDPLLPTLSILVTATGTTTARTIADRFGDTVNVRDFGAVGDGTTDDTAAIQSALNSGKDVLVSNGDFMCGSLTVSTANQKIVGAKGVIKHRAGVMLPYIFRINADNVTVRDLQLDGNLANVTGLWAFSESCIYIDQAGTNFALLDNSFSNWKSLAVFLNGGVPSNASVAGFMCRGNTFHIMQTVSLYLWIGPTSAIISGNRFTAQYKGAIRLYDQFAKKCIITDNYIEFTSGVALTGEPLAIEVHSLAGYSVAVEGGGENVIVANNVIIGSQAGGEKLWGISLDGCARFVVSGNTIRTDLLWGIEIVRGYGVVAGNAIEHVTGLPASQAAAIILNNPDGNCVVSGNFIKNVTQHAAIVLYGTTAFSHNISANTIDNAKWPVVSNHNGTTLFSGNTVVGGANSASPALIINCSAQQDNVMMMGNYFTFTSFGFGLVQTVGGNRWVIHNNRFDANGLLSPCLVVPAAYHRCSLQGNYIRNYNAKPVDTSASTTAKNVIGGNVYDLIGAPATYAAGDTSYNNTNIT